MSEDIEKLKQSNSELREIVNNSWDGIGIIDSESKFVYVNNAFSPILGFSKEELLGSLFTSYILPDFKEKFKELILKNIENRYTNDTQIVCKRKDGKPVYLEITLSLMLNKKFFVINAKDITKEISDDQILDKYVVSSHTDLNGVIVNASEAFCYISGYSKSELIGQPHSIVGNKNMDKEVFAKMWKTIKSGNEWSGKILNLKKDGSDFWVDVKIKPIYNKYGDITGFTSLMFDITNELSLKNQVADVKHEIKQKDEILVQQSKLAIMGETLQMISHEWRQPLNIISINAQKLELSLSMDEEPDISNAVKVLEEIKKKSDELSNTIEDFQSFVDLKSGKAKVNPIEIINKAVDIFKNDPDSANIDFVKDTMDTPEFETYPKELTTILVNILSNAKEAIIRNKKKLGVIKLKEYHLEGDIYFEVSDNGGGIAEDIIDKIFEPYFSTKDVKHGVGLGLYMCKIIIEMHLGGTISVANHNTGATFSIMLPMK